MGALNAKTWGLGQPGCFLQRRASLRFSPDQARREAEIGLKRLERPPEASDAAEASDPSKAFTIEARSITQTMVHDWAPGADDGADDGATGYGRPELTTELLFTTK